jgi:tetraacyldisaccharide 4'-kinase
MALRNHLYNIGSRRSLAFEPLVISVGNLSVGGTGKSPMVEYLARFIARQAPLAILSRGYKRKSRGIRIASEEDTAESLGDEPFQFYKKFVHNPELPHKVVVAVAEERATAIPDILFAHPEVQVILLDDAFQHRAVQADWQVLLTTWQRPFYRDHVLPMGRLREFRRGARRADAVVMTKCPAELDEGEQQKAMQKIRQYARPEVPIFFSRISYEDPRPVFEDRKALKEPLLLFSGLADGRLFEDYARQKYQVSGHIRWEDHHAYRRADFERIKAALEQQGEGAVLTTEKDMVKLLTHDYWRELPLYFLPIRTQFLAQETQFGTLVAELLQTLNQKDIE